MPNTGILVYWYCGIVLGVQTKYARNINDTQGVSIKYAQDDVIHQINCWTFTQITEDMSRTVREQWGELHKFMSRVKAKYPTSQCFLKQDKLYVDNRWVDSEVLFWHKRITKSNERVLQVPPIDTKLRCTGKFPKIYFIYVVILELWICIVLLIWNRIST